MEFLTEEFSENVSASTSAVFSCCFCLIFCEVFEGGWLGFSRDFPNLPTDCVGLGRGAQLVDIVLQTFFLGFLNEFSCFCPEEFEVAEISGGGGLLIEFT